MSPAPDPAAPTYTQDQLNAAVAAGVAQAIAALQAPQACPECNAVYDHTLYINGLPIPERHSFRANGLPCSKFRQLATLKAVA